MKKKKAVNPATTTTGIIALISGGLSLFTQIWGAINGAAVDPVQAATGIGAISSGIGLVKAQDAPKQPKQ